jgi:hypothetical protein
MLNPLRNFLYHYQSPSFFIFFIIHSINVVPCIFLIHRYFKIIMAFGSFVFLISMFSDLLLNVGPKDSKFPNFFSKIEGIDRNAS